MCIGGVRRIKYILHNSLLTQFITEILRFMFTGLSLDLEALGPIHVRGRPGEHLFTCFLVAGMSCFVKFWFESLSHFFTESSRSHLYVFVPLPIGTCLSGPKNRGRIPDSVTQLKPSAHPTREVVMLCGGKCCHIWHFSIS